MRTLLLVSVALAATASACGAPVLTHQERLLLGEFAMGPPPPDSSNAWADDPVAAVLGQQLFFDPRFSGPLVLADDGTNGGLGVEGESGKVSCSSCHDPSNGGSDHRSMPPNTSLAAGRTGRNAPTCLNAAWSEWQFWDGRKDSLWSQALGPTESAVEHNASRLLVAHVLDSAYAAQYGGVFSAFPDLSDAGRFPPSGKPGDPSWEGMTSADQQTINTIFVNFGKAVAAYERLLVSRDSSFDGFLAGDDGAMSDAAVRGAKLFVGRASCNECHRGPNLADGRFHNLGVPQIGDYVPAIDRGRADGIPQVVGDVFNRGGTFSDDPTSSQLGGLTAGPLDLGSFKTPTLRSVSRTAPYMHNGSLSTLRDVVLFYRDGGGDDLYVGQKSPKIRALLLSDRDVDDLTEFLRALDGAPLSESISTAPVLP